MSVQQCSMFTASFLSAMPWSSLPAASETSRPAQNKRDDPNKRGQVLLGARHSYRHSKLHMRYLCLVFQVVVLCSSQRRFLFQNVSKYLRVVSKRHGMFCFSQNRQRDLTCQAATRKWFQIRVQTGPVFNRILDSVKSYQGTDQGLGGGAKKEKTWFLLLLVESVIRANVFIFFVRLIYLTPSKQVKSSYKICNTK